MNKITQALILLSLVSACAEKNPNYKENPLVKLQELQEKKMQEMSKLEANKYANNLVERINKLKLKNLNLKFPDKENKAQIILEGLDAKAIYENLSVGYRVVLKKDSTSLATKNGLQISCSKKVAPRKKDQFKCLLDINYTTGFVSDVDAYSSESCINPPMNVETYTSKILKIGTNSQTKITLTQDTAEALYELLQVNEVDHKKVGHDYSCIKKTDAKNISNYTCSLKIESQYGQVLH